MTFELIVIILLALAGGLAMFGPQAVTEIALWRDRRHQARVRRIERELAQTQGQLEALALRHAAWLQACGHEARKALILESFRVSQEAQDNANDQHRC
jgi:hypothetical protein